MTNRRNQRFHDGEIESTAERWESAVQKMTDEQLIGLEESLYDAEVCGDDTWAERDQILWEMNKRGLMKAALK